MHQLAVDMPMMKCWQVADDALRPRKLLRFDATIEIIDYIHLTD